MGLSQGCKLVVGWRTLCVAQTSRSLLDPQEARRSHYSFFCFFEMLPITIYAIPDAIHNTNINLPSPKIWEMLSKILLNYIISPGFVSPLMVFSLCAMIVLSVFSPHSVKADTPTDNSPSLINNKQKLDLSPSLLGQKNTNIGDKISLNGRLFYVPWSQRAINGVIHTGLGDTSLMLTMGVDLLNTTNPNQQPIKWFSSEAPILNTWLTGIYRYLDITDFAPKKGWKIVINRDTLTLTTPSAGISNIRQGKQSWGDRVIIDLDHPTPWQIKYISEPPKPKVPHPPKPDDPTKPQGSQPKTLSDDPTKPQGSQPKTLPDDPTKPGKPQDKTTVTPPTQEWHITLDAQISPTLLQQKLSAGNQLKSVNIDVAGKQTRVKINIPLGLRPQVFTLANPNRLVIDIRPDFLLERNITWAPGLQWQQRYISLGKDRFPVFWFEVNLRERGIKVRPIFTNYPQSIKGTTSLLKIADKSQVAGAINAGFFNRVNQLSLGAIRFDNRWLSGPILNRGAIAWNDDGDIRIARLNLQETMITQGGSRLSVIRVNSADVQHGISRYTPEWGENYTPFSDDELIVTIEKDKVTHHNTGNTKDKMTFSIPKNGYILVLRSLPSAIEQLVIGSNVRVESETNPPEFNRFPYIVGGGPFLVQNSQVVLDAKAENFNAVYQRQTAIRSGIGKTVSGNLLIVAAHNRAGGSGPTFAEFAQIMQKMGAIEALNLDGGSSTSLYLGGELLDRPSQTAARVHNGIGVFFQP
jgi:Phosphodiester glycosidase/AMIN domain